MVAGVGASLPISVSLNGQQYSALSQPVQLHEPPVLQFISPACGPARGHTRLTMVGSQLWGGSAYRCRFGGPAYAERASLPTRSNQTVVTEATYDATLPGGLAPRSNQTVVTEATYDATLAGGLVRCSVPALSAMPTPTSRWSMDIALSLNAQQFHRPESGRVAPGSAPTFQAPPGYRLYLEPEMSAHALPAAVRNSQVVSLYANDLHGGCAYACRFDRLGDASGIGVAVPGSFDALTSRVSCAAPSWPAGSGAAVWVSLNGPQFSPSGANLTSGCDPSGYSAVISLSYQAL